MAHIIAQQYGQTLPKETIRFMIGVGLFGVAARFYGLIHEHWPVTRESFADEFIYAYFLFFASIGLVGALLSIAVIFSRDVSKKSQYKVATVIFGMLVCATMVLAILLVLTDSSVLDEGILIKLFTLTITPAIVMATTENWLRADIPVTRPIFLWLYIVLAQLHKWILGSTIAATESQGHISTIDVTAFSLAISVIFLLYITAFVTAYADMSSLPTRPEMGVARAWYVLFIGSVMIWIYAMVIDSPQAAPMYALVFFGIAEASSYWLYVIKPKQKLTETT